MSLKILKKIHWGIFIYLGLSLFSRYPSFEVLKSGYMGLTGIDTDGMLWSNWFRKLAWTTGSCENFIPFIGSPHGFDFSYVPYQRLLDYFAVYLFPASLNEVVTNNLSIWLSFFLSAVTGYFLVYHITRNRWASFISGFIYSFGTYHLAQGRGSGSALHIEFMPLYILFLIRMLDRKTVGSAFGCAAMFSINFHMDQYYGFFMLFFSSLFAIYYLLIRPTNFARYFKVIVLATFFAITLTVLMNPLFFLNSFHLAGRSAEVGRNLLSGVELRPFLEFFIPPNDNPIWGKFVRGHGNTWKAFLGFTPLLLGFYGLCWKQVNAFISTIFKRKIGAPASDAFYTKQSDIRFLSFGFLFSGVILAGASMPPLANVIWTFFPFLRALSRLVLVVQLCVAVLAGVGLTYLLSYVRTQKARMLVTMGVFCIVSLEFIQTSCWIKVDFSETPPVYQWLAQQEGDIIVAEYPRTLSLGEIGVPAYHYLFWQRVHQKRLINGVQPDNLAHKYLRKSTLDIEDSRTYPLLKALGVRYVIVHPQLYNRAPNIPAGGDLRLIKRFPPDFRGRDNSLYTLTKSFVYELDTDNESLVRERGDVRANVVGVTNANLDGLTALSYSSEVADSLPIILLPQGNYFPNSILFNASVFLSHRGTLADLSLQFLKSKYHYGTSTLAKHITFSPRRQDLFAILAKTKFVGEMSKIDPVFEGTQLTSPNLNSEPAKFLHTSRQWKYFGNAYLSSHEEYRISLLKTGKVPLSDWRLFKQETFFDLYETSLSDHIFEGYSIRDSSDIVYKDGLALKPTRNQWVRDVESVQVENRRVIINIPKDQTPTETYTYSYRSTPPLSEDIEEFVIVPLDTLEAKFREVKAMLSQPKYRLSHLFTDEKNSFYIPKGEDYIAKVHMSPDSDSTATHLLRERTDWEEELGHWSSGGRDQAFESRYSQRNVFQPIVLYSKNFYPMEEDYPDRYRWGRNNLELIVMNPSDKDIKGTLKMEISSIIDRDLQVSVNRNLVKTLHIPSGYEKAYPTIIERMTNPIPFIGRPMYPYEEPYPVEPDTILVEGIRLHPGDNEIVLYSSQGGQVMDELVGNGDPREVCLVVWNTVRFRIQGEEDRGQRSEVGGRRSEARGQKAVARSKGAIGNTEFSYNIEDKKLEVPAYFDGDKSEQEYMLMQRDFRSGERRSERGETHSPLTGVEMQGVDLERYPHFRLGFELDDPSVQEITAAFGIDHSGDGVADGYVTSSSSDTASAMRLDLFERARERFSEEYYRERRDLKLVKMFLILHKKWGLDVKQPSKEGQYTFKLGNINLVSERSLMVPGYVKGFYSDEDLTQWKFNPENVTYSTQVTREDGLLVSPRFDSRILGVKEEEKTGELDIQMILRDGGILTGVIESEDEETIHLTEVKELHERDVIVQKGNISLIFGAREWKKTFEEESVVMTTALKGLDLKQTPYLSLTYKLQDASVQTIGFSLRVDLDGDEVADTTLFPGRTETLKDWKYVGSFGKIDLYESRLSEDFPASYTTEVGGKGKFEVLKEDARMTATWRGWSYKEGMVQVGFEEPRRVVVSVPSGTAPTVPYMVRYLPLSQQSEMYPGYETLEINLKEVLEDAFPEHPRARPVGLVLSLKRMDEADLTTTTDGMDRKGSYDFYLKKASFYRKYAFPLKEQAKEVLESLKGTEAPLVRVADTLYRLNVEGNDSVLTREGAWLPPMKVHLKEGVYEDGVEFLPNPTFKVDLMELANKPYEPPVETARVRFRKINPTRYQVFVRADEPFELVFSESFHKGWKAYTKPISPEESEWAWSAADTTEDGSQLLSGEGKPGWSAVLTALKDRGRRTEIETHYVVNGYANGWHVEPGEGRDQGSGVRGQGEETTNHQREFEIVLEYKPQRLFEIGVVISALTLVGCIGYLGVDFGRRRKKRTP